MHTESFFQARKKVCERERERERDLSDDALPNLFGSRIVPCMSDRKALSGRMYVISEKLRNERNAVLSMFLLGGGLFGGGALPLLLLLSQGVGSKSGLLLLLAKVELLVGVRRRLESGSEGGGLGRVGISRRLLDLCRGLVHALQLWLHEFACSLVDGESELVHVEVLLHETVLHAQALFFGLHDPGVQSLALLNQILFFVALDVERRDNFSDGLELGGIFLGLLTRQILLSLLQDEDLEHTLLLFGKLEFSHRCWSRIARPKKN